MISPKRLAELKAKHDAFTITEEEYVEYRQATEEVSERYARRMFGTAYQSAQIPVGDRPLMAV